MLYTFSGQHYILLMKQAMLLAIHTIRVPLTMFNLIYYTVTNPVLVLQNEINQWLITRVIEVTCRRWNYFNCKILPVHYIKN